MWALFWKTQGMFIHTGVRSIVPPYSREHLDNVMSSLSKWKLRKLQIKKHLDSDSCCGSVGRAVAYYTRDQQIKSRHRQNFIYQLYIRKDKNKEKESGNGPSWKKLIKKYHQDLGIKPRKTLSCRSMLLPRTNLIGMIGTPVIFF